MISLWFFAAGVHLLALHSTSHACYLLRVEFLETKTSIKVGVSRGFPFCWLGFT